MTNLQRWLLYAGLFLVPYLSVVSGVIQSKFLTERMFQIIMLPFVLVALFGVHSLVTILYRVFTLSDCTEAAQELQKQIKEAREDLISKGFKFRD
ncbi:dolichol-phosphate mannosyltransferase subunit 3 [Hermetia illucens]|uniref:dolichol-phosphate mannosyltransferase subunit 3 n=1 Tax=Hermetia illucens TaxID=343691 RepID=UPI0018CC286C|nr:dolichol-phosphate mannosyltransferase subunit 3 [Hermetia illucens]